jgi:hypothetical protein
VRASCASRDVDPMTASLLEQLIDALRVLPGVGQ